MRLHLWFRETSVGLSITYSFAAATLISGRIDAVFARFVRPWTLIAWISLTLGIAMGSYWAYYTLGWGGFWFWDPVEKQLRASGFSNLPLDLPFGARMDCFCF